MFGAKLTQSSPKELMKLVIDDPSVAVKLKGRVWCPNKSMVLSSVSFKELSMEHTADAAAVESSEMDKTS